MTLLITKNTKHFCNVVFMNVISKIIISIVIVLLPRQWFDFPWLLGYRDNDLNNPRSQGKASTVLVLILDFSPMTMLSNIVPCEMDKARNAKGSYGQHSISPCTNQFSLSSLIKGLLFYFLAKAKLTSPFTNAIFQ